MSTDAILLRRIEFLEEKYNEMQTALNNLTTRKEMKNIFALLQQQLSDLENSITELESTVISLQSLIEE